MTVNQKTYGSMDDAFVPYENGAGDWVTSEAEEEELLSVYERLFFLLISPHGDLVESLRVKANGAIIAAIEEFDTEGRIEGCADLIEQYSKYGSAYAKRILDEACKIYVNKMTKAR